MSDCDKGLRAADDDIPLVTRAICLEHLHCNLQKNCGLGTRRIFNSAIRYALIEESSKLVWTDFRKCLPKQSAIYGL